MGDDNTREAAVIGTSITRDAYEAAATLASLISAPISTSYSEEMTCNEPLQRQVYNEPNKKVEKFISHDKNSTIGTRKFTRDDDINLIRGILKHGKSNWKKIWQDTPELQHIKHAALKDRGRSKRFQHALHRASEDPSLLDRPGELLGGEHNSWYVKASGISNKNDSNEKNDSDEAVGRAKPKPLIEVGRAEPPPIEVSSGKKKRGGKAKVVEPPIEVASARPLFMSGPLQDGNEPTIVSMAAPCNSGSYSIHMAAAKMLTDAARATTKRSGAATRATTKRSAAEVVKTEATYNKRPKQKQEAKPNLRNNKKGLRTLQNGEVDEFPGWTCEKILRKNSTHYDRSWSHKSLAGVNVRSRVGMREMMEKMERGVNAQTAYEMLMSEGKTKYFKRTGSKS